MFLLNQVLPLLYGHWINSWYRDRVCNSTCIGMEENVTILRSKYCWSHHVTRSSAEVVSSNMMFILNFTKLVNYHLNIYVCIWIWQRMDDKTRYMHRLTEPWREIHNLQKYPKSDKTANTWTAVSTFGWTDSFSTISQSGSDSCCVLDTSSVGLTTSPPLAGSRIKAWYNSRWPFTRDLALCHKTELRAQI